MAPIIFDETRIVNYKPALPLLDSTRKRPGVTHVLPFFGLAALVLLAMPAAAHAEATSPSLPPPVPFKAEVADPLLEPVPPAEKELASWDEAIALARNLSTDERKALAQVERAAGRSKQALSALLPNIRASAQLTLNVLDPEKAPVGVAPVIPGERSPSAPLGSANITGTQAVIDVGAWRGLSAARAAEDSAYSSLRGVRRRLVDSLARNLVGVAAAERVAEMNRVGLRLALEREALTRRKLELGAATQLDLVRVQQDLQVAREAVVSGDEQLQRAREALGLALGLDQGVGPSPSFDITGLVDESLAQCRRLADVNDRSDVLAARFQLESARKSRLQALAGYYPTLGLTTSLFGYTTDPGFGRIGSWNVAAVLSIPIWEGGFRAGLVREREAAEIEAGEVLEQTQRNLSVEVVRSRRNVDVAAELLETATEARNFAFQADELTRRSFEIGRSTSIELVQSASTLRQADVSLAVREFDWVQARLSAFLTEASCEF